MPAKNFVKLHILNWIQKSATLCICNGWNVYWNGTASVPKSVLRYVVDKVKLNCSDLRPVIPKFMPRIKVPNKSL